MGNSALPLGHRLIAHAKLFCQLFLCHSEGLSFPGDVRSNFDQIHSITSLLALSLLFFHAGEHPSEVESVFFSEKDSAKPKTELQQSLLIAKRKPLAELVERKSLRLWTKIKLLVKVKLGLPTNKTRNKEDLIVDKDISSLEHTRWRCQYHVVFAPKYRRLAIYGELKQDIGYILGKLCERKGIEIIEAEACPDHIHMLISIPPKLSVSQVMGYLKGKSSLMIFDRHANLKYKYGNRHFWARGYYVDTVGRNKKAIQEYIQNQLKEDELADQLSIKEYFDPFTGEKVDQGRKGQKGSFTSSKRK